MNRALLKAFCHNPCQHTGACSRCECEFKHARTLTHTCMHKLLQAVSRGSKQHLSTFQYYAWKVARHKMFVMHRHTHIHTVVSIVIKGILKKSFTDCRVQMWPPGFSCFSTHNSLVTQMLHSEKGASDWPVNVEWHVEVLPIRDERREGGRGGGEREVYLQMKFKATSPASLGRGS